MLHRPSVSLSTICCAVPLRTLNPPAPPVMVCLCTSYCCVTMLQMFAMGAPLPVTLRFTPAWIPAWILWSRSGGSWLFVLWCSGAELAVSEGGGARSRRGAVEAARPRCRRRPAQPVAAARSPPQVRVAAGAPVPAGAHG